MIHVYQILKSNSKLYATSKLVYFARLTFQCGVFESKSPFHTSATVFWHASWYVNFIFSVSKAVIIGDCEPKSSTFVVRSCCVMTSSLVWQRFNRFDARDVNSLL